MEMDQPKKQAGSVSHTPRHVASAHHWQSAGDSQPPTRTRGLICPSPPAAGLRGSPPCAWTAKGSSSTPAAQGWVPSLPASLEASCPTARSAQPSELLTRVLEIPPSSLAPKASAGSSSPCWAPPTMCSASGPAPVESLPLSPHPPDAHVAACGYHEGLPGRAAREGQVIALLPLAKDPASSFPGSRSPESFIQLTEECPPRVCAAHAQDGCHSPSLTRAKSTPA